MINVNVWMCSIANVICNVIYYDGTVLKVAGSMDREIVEGIYA